MRWTLLCLCACTGIKPTSSSSGTTGTTPGTVDTADPSFTPPGSPPGIAWWGVGVNAHLGHAVAAFDGIVVLSAPGAPDALDDPVNSWVGLAEPPFLGGGTSHSQYHDVITDPDQTEYEHSLVLGQGLLAPGDVTGDGAGDLVVFAGPSDRNYGQTAYLVDSEQMWSRTIALPDATVPSLAQALRGTPCGDVTGDGLADLCLDIGIVPGPFTVGSLPVVTWSGAAPSEAIRLAADDLDQDGHTELLLWDPPAATVRRLASFPDGDHDLPSLAVASYAAQGSACISLVTGGDLDGDGARDFAVAVDDQTYIMTALAADTPLANAPTFLKVPVDDLAIADLNGDGQADLAVAGDGAAYVYYGPLPPGELVEADADHAWATTLNVFSYGSYMDDALYAADADLDGHTDLLIGVPGEQAGSGHLWLVPGPLP